MHTPFQPVTEFHFFDRKGILTGTQIVRIDGNHVYPDNMHGITGGTDIFVNYSRLFIKSIESAKSERRIAVSLELTIKENTLVLSACDDAKNCFTAEAEYTGEKARDAEKAEQVLREQLSKLGSTYFVLSKLTIPPEMPFVPIKTINDLRRRALDGLAECREQNYLRIRKPFLKTDMPYPEKEISAQGNVYNKRAEQFYARHGAVVIERAFESGVSCSNRTVLTSKYCLLDQIGLCKKTSPRKYAEPLVLSVAGKKFSVRTDCSACVISLILV